MSLTREDVEKVALLARLRLSSDELDTMTSQLGQVLGYIQQLDQLDTTDIEPLAHPLDLFNVLAADELSAGLPREKALAAAPKSDDECFLVPAVLGD
jgi:aspartyl-tRNA(Asn)/glutamyl-tRNA(Gln) amidotransferase subunit C